MTGKLLPLYNTQKIRNADIDILKTNQWLENARLKVDID